MQNVKRKIFLGTERKYGRFCFVVLGHEKMRGEQLKWSLAYRLYIGSFPCAQLPGPVHIQPGWAECVFCVFSLGLCFVCPFMLFNLCVPILLCFPGQLSDLPYSFGASITNLNEPPKVLAVSTIAWVYWVRRPKTAQKGWNFLGRYKQKQRG